MKKLSFILLAAMLSISLSAFSVSRIAGVSEEGNAKKVQVPSTEEYFAESDIIIETRLPDNRESFIHRYDAVGNYDRGDIYTSGYCIVTYVYKNNSGISISQGDTLNILVKGGYIFKGATIYEEEEIRAYPQPDKPFQIAGYPDIYFMKKSDLPDNPDISKRNKHPKVTPLRIPIERLGEAEDNGAPQLDNRYELYKYMEQFEGLTVPLSDPIHMRWHLGGDSEEFKQYLKERNLRDPRAQQGRDSVRHSIEMKFREVREKERKQRLLKSSLTNNVLTVTIKNQAVRYDHAKGKYYFEFYVYANANNDLTYLNTAQLVITYNSAAFGTKIANKVEIINSPEFKTTPYNQHGFWDITSDGITYNALVLGFGISVPNPVRTQIKTTPYREYLPTSISLQ